MRKIIYSFIEVKKAGKNTYFFLALLFEVSIKGRAEYGNRTRLPGLGSPCTTDVLIPLVCIYNNSIIIKVAFVVSLLKSRYPDSNRGPTHYECVALPTEPYRQKRMQRYIQKRRNQNICRYFYLLLKQYSV